MALIRKSDIEEIRSRTNIADVIGEQVTLKRAGIGSMKGLCPFHDERTPSFHVRPQLGYYHCFGCGESGDVYTFLQKVDHLSFTEAVERLAERIGYQLTYEDGADAERSRSKARLYQANREAQLFFAAQLHEPAAEPGQRFLGERGFDGDAAATFGLGYAPNSWDALKNHLTGKGFSVEELVEVGLLTKNESGRVYDRFRGRVMWPIRDLTGQTLGFGARRLLDDDKGPKYLNTPETPIYHKAQVLYGLDLAKREISREHRVVVVEGYTDVMACHLAGVTTAVATCGTSFGVDHIRVLRRVMGDDGGGSVIFTFDPDEAGQKAALRAFSEEKRFSSQTFVAVPEDGLDPCDLRLAKGDGAVRRMIESPQPMFEFAIKSMIAGHELETVEGRVAALRQAAPVVAGIRDAAVRPGYTRELAKWLGMDINEVARAVKQAGVGQRAISAPKRDAGSGFASSPRSEFVEAPTRFGDAARSGQAGRSGGTRGSRGLGGAHAVTVDARGRVVDEQIPHAEAPLDDGAPEGADAFGAGVGAGSGSSGFRRDDATPATVGITGAGAQGRRSDTGTASSGSRAPGLAARDDDLDFGSARASTSDAVRRAPVVRLSSLPADPQTRLERDVLMVMLQAPDMLTPERFRQLLVVRYQTPALSSVRDAILEAIATHPGQMPSASTLLGWVRELADDSLKTLVTELAIAPIPTNGTDEHMRAYANGVVVALLDRDLLRRKGELLGRLQRSDAKPDSEEYRELQFDLARIEGERRGLRAPGQ